MSCACGKHKTPQACAGARHLATLPFAVKVRKPSGRPRASRRRGPLCACGCGVRTHGREHRWATPACIPPGTRAAKVSATMRRLAARRRAERFRAEIARMKRRISCEELLALFQIVWERGYAACLGREKRRGAAA
ncbi:MAG TPA: hypothetical protein VN654_24030 [Vicinamibacterales bacterium]|nr:hypothetical protein [Vicinamibacterales bacterium]